MTWRPRPESEALAGRPPPHRLPGDLEGYLLPSYVDLRAARANLTEETRRLPAEERRRRRRERETFGPVPRPEADAAWLAFAATPEGRAGQERAQRLATEHELRGMPLGGRSREMRLR